MTNHELRAWLARRALTQKAAAEMLGLTEGGLRQQISGRHPVSEQTRQLCQLWDAYHRIAPMPHPHGYYQTKPTEE